MMVAYSAASTVVQLAALKDFSMADWKAAMTALMTVAYSAASTVVLWAVPTDHLTAAPKAVSTVVLWAVSMALPMVAYLVPLKDPSRADRRDKPTADQKAASKDSRMADQRERLTADQKAASKDPPMVDQRGSPMDCYLAELMA